MGTAFFVGGIATLALLAGLTRTSARRRRASIRGMLDRSRPCAVRRASP
ncbi:MAG TPA: hypothetical protein VMR31_09690 [Myxococcota bacterium]|nr:hypothetical protein [Myxococcota bacterium]